MMNTDHFQASRVHARSRGHEVYFPDECGDAVIVSVHAYPDVSEEAGGRDDEEPARRPEQRKLVSIVAPFYNEDDGVEHFYRALCPILDSMTEVDFEVICIDDGSRDRTLEKLVGLCSRHAGFRVIELSRNFGKEAALTAGIDCARGDAVIPLDGDLQDPPELIPTLIGEWRRGAEVVLAHRIERNADTLLKRKSAEAFYRFHNRVCAIEVPENVGDFRLMDRVVVTALKRLPERQRFMKGLFAWVGFKTVTVHYARQPRAAGKSKFSFWKLLNFAIEGLTSFSTAPLKVWTYLGGFTALLTLIYAAFIVLRTLLHGIAVPGYASLMVVLLTFSSLQLISIGLLGEYIGRIYMETKQRPTYLIRKQYEAECPGPNAQVKHQQRP